MNRTRICSSVLVVLLSGIISEATALAQRPAAKKKPMVELYVVVDIDGELSVMKKSEQTALLKQNVLDFKESMKSYAEARKAAAKNKEKLDQPKPKMKKIKVMGTSCKTQELAEERMEKLQKAREKLKAKRPSREAKPLPVED